jgi:hypothetical protein
MTGLAERNAIVFALCHEVGNLVASIRLNAHWIAPDSSGLDLATACIEIDDASTRIRSLLALVRPLLTEPAEDDPGVSPDALVWGVGEALDECGGRGVTIEVEVEDGLQRVPGRLAALHHLLATFAYYAIEEARPNGRVWIRGLGADGSVVFGVEDDGPQDEDLGKVGGGTPTGRSLACEVAKIVLGSLGGRVDARRTGDITRIELTLPALE